MRSPIPVHYKKIILERQEYKCNICSIFLDVCDIDHITPYRVTLTHKISNLQALCPNCHAKKTRTEQKDILTYIKCEKTKSQRYCWTCKKIVSLYFGYQDGTCMNCTEQKLSLLNIGLISLSMY